MTSETSTPNALQSITGGHWYGPTLTTTVTGYCHDTRHLHPGNIFIAQKTDNADGHDFLADAHQKGAAAAIVQVPNPNIDLPQLKVDNPLEAFQTIAREHRASFSGKVIGITGSCGKTTTKDLLAQLLANFGTHANHKNWNNALGVPLSLMGLDNDLHEFGIIEAGMNHRHEMERLAWMIEPDLSIITVIAPVHLENVGTIEDVAWEKSCLARGTMPNGNVLFPASCLAYEPFLNFNGRARVLVKDGDPAPKSIKPEQCYYYRVQHLEDSDIITLSLPTANEFTYAVPKLSDGMLGNFALALTAAHILGRAGDHLQEALDNWTPSEYRGQVIKDNNRFFYADCYNANPVAMKDALRNFNQLADKDLDRVYVLGCMGELGAAAPQYHYETGHSIRLRTQDHVYVIGDHAESYCQGLWDAGNEGKNIHIAKTLNDIRPILHQFEGAIFLKGSRVYQLWELLPNQSNTLTPF